MAYISMTLSHFRHGGRTARLATPRARSGSDGYYSWFLVSKTKFPDHPRFMFSAGVSLQCVIGGTPPRCHWARRDDGGFCSIRSPSHFAPCPLSLTTATRFEINVAEQIPICLFGHASNDHVLANGTGNITSFAFHSILLLGELDRLIFCLHLQQSASWVSAEMDVLLKPSFETPEHIVTTAEDISPISELLPMHHVPSATPASLIFWLLTVMGMAHGIQKTHEILIDECRRGARPSLSQDTDIMKGVDSLEGCIFAYSSIHATSKPNIAVKFQELSIGAVFPSAPIKSNRDLGNIDLEPGCGS
ncbi:hypothetical protein C8J56DRAFT_897724 [Mycena floridula]|nr:hypothetical protein C8J56DRAFT_897724 [Mycena floridula]